MAIKGIKSQKNLFSQPDVIDHYISLFMKGLDF